MSHNEDFIKTAIPDELWDSAVIVAEGKQFVGIDSFLNSLADDEYVIKISSIDIEKYFNLRGVETKSMPLIDAKKTKQVANAAFFISISGEVYVRTRILLASRG